MPVTSISWRMAAGNQQRNERELGRIFFQQRCQQVAFEVVHADSRHLESESQRGGDTRAHQQCTGQPRPFGVGNAFNILKGAIRFLQHLAGERQDAADMVARGEFRHHAAVFGVHRHLGMQGVRKQAALRVVERNAGFIAGGFDSQN